MADKASSLPEMSISSSPDEIWIILMGRRGSGKSSSGNTILGENKLKVHKQKKRHDANVYNEVTQIGGKQVCVIDCPDLLDPDLSEEKCESLKEQLISGCLAGLSSVLITIPVEEPVQHEEEIMHYIKDLFGSEVQKFMMILFTHGDELEELDKPQTIDEYLQDHEDLQRLVTKCGGKFHCFNNKSKSNNQKQELMQKIEETMDANGGKFIMELMMSDSLETESSDDPENAVIPDLEDQVRLVLLGKTGAGKSATGNTIIGRNVFEFSAGLSSQTKECRLESTVRMGKNISVIDTPGLYDTQLSPEQILTEIVKCLTYASPGPHVFLVVIKVDRFTEEEKNTIEQLKEVFGEEIQKYTMIIFTHKDELDKKNRTMEELLQHCDESLQDFIQMCGNRYFCLDNDSASFPQFRDLIRDIEKMVMENGGHFSKTFETIDIKIDMKKFDEKVKQFKQICKWITQTAWSKVLWRFKQECQKEVMLDIVTQVAFFAVTICLKKALKTSQSGESEAIKQMTTTINKLAKQKMCVIQ